jgi:hypothetical protein
MKNLAIVIILMIAGALAVARAETRVSGIIDRNERWTPEKGPYLINGDLLIGRKGYLVITPGTQIMIGTPSYPGTGIDQIDHTDSQMVAIHVRGMLTCQGSPTKRVSISPLMRDDDRCHWYGIIFDGSYDQLTEVSFTDISGACNAITVRGCSPTVRNCIFENNNVGINCLKEGNAKVYNCVIARNTTCGIHLQSANPVFYNNILVSNKNNGIWCDGISAMTFAYNCLFDNLDGNFMECDPELGVITPSKKSRIPTDGSGNIYCNPVFAGTSSDSLAAEKDTRIPTDRSRIADTVLAKTLHDTLIDSSAIRRVMLKASRYELSAYSPCINAGNPDKKFKNKNGTRNDIGIGGGPEFFGESK